MKKQGFLSSDSSDQGCAEPVSSELFRHGMRHVPSVVTVVTMADKEGIQGVTIGSFVSLSLDPPLVCFNVQRSIAIHDRIVGSSGFAVHVLREDQSALSDLFARSDMDPHDQFRSLAYELTGNGIPLLNDCLVRFLCTRVDVLPGGDHSILVGEVVAVQEGEIGRPVVYHQRAYHGVGAHIADHDHTPD